jgi:hypothetical protein
MRSSHAATAVMILLCLGARCAHADHAGASQTLNLAVNLPCTFSTLGPEAMPLRQVALAVDVPGAGAPAAAMCGAGGRLQWATWASAREPRTVTAQLDRDLPSGLRLHLNVTPGRPGASGRAVCLGSTAIQVLAGLSGGGLQMASVGYEAAVAAGSVPTSMGLAVVYTLGD